MAESELKCGYECGARATIDVVWPNDGDVWHLCPRHADALQTMLDAQSEPWAAKVIQRPAGTGDDRRDAGDDDDAPTPRGWRERLRRSLQARRGAR